MIGGDVVGGHDGSGQDTIVKLSGFDVRFNSNQCTNTFILYCSVIAKEASNENRL